MKKLGKKLMALTMAGALACTPVTVFAAAPAVTTEENGTVTGNASVLDGSGYTGSIPGEASGIIGTVSTDIFKVVLPIADVDTNNDTTKDALSALSFTMDPQMLISDAIANGNTVTGFTNVADNATILFANRDTSGAVTGYSDTSDPITIINKGTIPVSVELKPSATVADDSTTPPDGSTAKTLAIANDAASFKTDGTPEICLSLNTGEATPTAILPTAPTNGYKFELGEAPEGAYKTTYDTVTDKFEYALDESFDSSLFEKKEFTISGKANPDSTINWNSVAADKATINLAWTITKGIPFNGTKPVFASTTAGKIDVTAGTTDYANISIDSVIATVGSKTFDLAQYSLDTSNLANGITFDAATIQSATFKNTATVTITYTATHGTTSSKTKQITETIDVPLK